MEKINTITVNGVTYSVGGSGASEDSFIIPLAYSQLEHGDKSNVLEAFGGKEKIDEMLKAVSEGKPIYIRLKNGITPAFVQGSTAIFISWYDVTGGNLEIPSYIYTNILIAGSSVLAFIKRTDPIALDNKLVVDIYDLTLSSSNEDIKTALGDKWSYAFITSNGIVQKRIKGNDAHSINMESGLNYYMVMGDNSSDYTIKISCNLSGCFGKEKGGIITINYTDGNFSVTDITPF